MEGLPNDIHCIIDDMACRKQHNNTATQYGIIIVVDVEFAKKIEGDFESTLDGWIWDSLDRAHRALDFDSCWQFVSNVLRDQWTDDEDISDDYEPEADENRYQVCINIECMSGGMDNDTGLFSYAYEPQGALVHPARVLEHFTAPPTEVRGVAISGVGQEVLKKQWIQCIAQDSNEFDRQGRGYMRHPMWVLPEQFQDGSFSRLDSVREMSFNFRWPNYPGNLGDDW